MIGASVFANSYTAFWRLLTPTCDFLVRRVNQGDYQRVYIPLSQIKGRVALVAEYAFAKFAAEFTASYSGLDALDEVAWKETLDRLAPYLSEGRSVAPLVAEELEEANQLHRRLRDYFYPVRATMIVRPLFCGCGFLDTSEGDVLSGENLFEIKAVDRPIRSSDIRQLLTYAALNYSSGQFQIQSVSLFNPRRGIVASFLLDQLCEQISGLPKEELLAQICDTVSNSGLSR